MFVFFIILFQFHFLIFNFFIFFFILKRINLTRNITRANSLSKMTTPCKILSTHIIIGNDLFLQKLSTLLIKEKKERN